MGKGATRGELLGGEGRFGGDDRRGGIVRGTTDAGGGRLLAWGSS
jgi:hypothetical protein